MVTSTRTAKGRLTSSRRSTAMRLANRPAIREIRGVGVFSRYLALGDSFTEGVGDAYRPSPNGLRGWADRVAVALAQTNPELHYANLAVRGRRMTEFLDEQ